MKEVEKRSTNRIHLCIRFIYSSETVGHPTMVEHRAQTQQKEKERVRAKLTAQE
jgi:hypothetical protein